MALYDDNDKRFSTGIKLVPGSTADTIAKGIGNFKANYQAKQAAAGASIPDYNVPRPAVATPPIVAKTAPVAAPAIPNPRPGASSIQARKSPSQSMTLDQANAAEVNARTSTQTPAQPTTGAASA